MNRVRNFFIAIGAVTGIFSQGVSASTSAEQITTAVDQFMTQYQRRLTAQYGAESDIRFQILAIDPRLSLADCAQPLDTQAKGRQIGNRLNVQVSCNGTNPWSVYIPVQLQVMRPIVVANRPVARGEILEQSDLSLRRLDSSLLSGAYFHQLDDVVGQQARRTLNANEVIYDHSISAPLVIKRGESVIITAKTGSLLVKMTAIAMSDGRLGEQISVKNSQSKRIVDALVTAPGQVEVVL